MSILSDVRDVVSLYHPKSQSNEHQKYILKQLYIRDSYQPKPPRVIRWNKPQFGKVKLNTDGCSRGNPDDSAGAAILRDHRGVFILASSAHFGIHNSLISELRAVNLGLRMCKENGFLSLVIELDCKTLVNLINDNPEHIPWQLYPWWKEFLLNRNMSNIFHHTCREGNRAVDFLANHACSSHSSEMYQHFQELPTTVKGEFNMDRRMYANINGYASKTVGFMLHTITLGSQEPFQGPLHGGLQGCRQHTLQSFSLPPDNIPNCSTVIRAAWYRRLEGICSTIRWAHFEWCWMHEGTSKSNDKLAKPFNTHGNFHNAVCSLGLAHRKVTFLVTLDGWFDQVNQLFGGYTDTLSKPFEVAYEVFRLEFHKQGVLMVHLKAILEKTHEDLYIFPPELFASTTTTCKENFITSVLIVLAVYLGFFGLMNKETSYVVSSTEVFLGVRFKAPPPQEYL